jgi:phosphoglycolate phosphatase-like HAD superfamily hydrolase
MNTMSIYPPLYIFDIDGTLADLTHRVHYVRNEDGTKKKHGQANWDKFHTECVNDKPIMPVFHTLDLLRKSRADILFFSGRNASVRHETVQWLTKQFVEQLGWQPEAVHENLDIPSRLYMRAADDRRQDYLVKEDMYNALSYVDQRRLVAIFDDRDQVVQLWRSKGIQCFQVNYGDF